MISSPTQQPIKPQVPAKKPAAITTEQDTATKFIIQKSARKGSMSTRRSLDFSPYLSMTPRTKYGSSNFFLNIDNDHILNIVNTVKPISKKVQTAESPRKKNQ